MQPAGSLQTRKVPGMKFIHTGDIHYGMHPDADRPWGRERAEAVRDSLAAIVSCAAAEKTDLLLVAGDLFHRQPLIRDLKEVNSLFASIPDTRVVIIAGNHDRVRESSAVLSFPWAENVSYIYEETMQDVYFEDLNTTVTGFSWHSPEIREPLLKGIAAPLDGHIHILLCHGGDVNHLPITREDLSGSGFSYCALAHIHKPQLLSENAAFCGSPEPLDLTETGKHGFYKGEIDPQTGKLTTLKFVPCAKTEYVSLIINVTTRSTNSELLNRIGELIRSRGPENIYRLRLRGMRDPDIEFDLNSLQDRFHIAEIRDETEPQYDFHSLFKEHSSDMIGFFIRDLDRPDMSPIDKKALFYGVDALLRTQDERSGGK